MSNLLFSFNSVAPVFLLVALGWLARKTKLVGPAFIESASKLNFRTGLPALLFINIYEAQSANNFNWKFIGFMTIGCLAIALILFLVVPRIVPDKSKASAIVHTVFKPNIIVLGLPLAVMMFGKENVSAFSMLMPVVVPVNNIAAVLILCAMDPENQDTKHHPLGKALTNVVKNPIILAAFAAIILQQLHIALPVFIVKVISSLSDMATPFALITLGAQMTMDSALSDRNYVMSATVLKVLATPLIIVPLAYWFGFRSYELAAAFIIASSPSAVNCYMLAREMHSDEILTGEIVLSSTFCSMFVLFIGIFILKTLAILP